MGISLVRGQSLQNLHACYDRLGMSVATALEMYSTDNQGRYPPDLQVLVEQRYLRSIPSCPSAGKITYRGGYSVTGETYTIACQGTHHWLAREILGLKGAPDFPYYSSETGLCTGE